MIFESKGEFLNELNKLNKFKVLGIDFGFKKSGLAIYNSEVNVVTPLIIFNNITSEFDKLIKLLSENRVNAVIVGYPLHLDGNETVQTDEIKKFAGMLVSKVNIPIILSDERFTTSLANTLLKEAKLKRKVRNKMDDMVSASILLENFFY
ncbi:Holliday junction resolvase RuvX [Candidatus Bandiella numerosa]|jgi:putative Holliday junction resolvase|uniref:Holliday junction resolvase RuvX n=1 Tax=Candidatus Bandiella numerosa TaxID=2570586 RepID=UPI00249E39B0|nr:Holliday junction resolvase RuvX [Candidatus Bandiella numerosa]WHA04667.1 Holliday junction resolvase RuvX [Candidatus Bandiella numerosa]